MSNEDYVILKILKGLSEHLHREMAIYRKTIHGKKKHDFNFKSVVRISTGHTSIYPKSLINIWKWSQDRKRYYDTYSMQIVFVEPSAFSIRHIVYRGNVSIDATFEISNPDCFDLITQELIKHLDWRG